MPQVSEEYIVSLKVQLQQALNSLHQFDRTVDKTVKKNEKGTKKVAKDTRTMGNDLWRTITRLAGAYVGFRTVVEGIEFNTFVEQTETAFGVMMKNVDLAKDKIAELREFSLTIPFTFKEVVKGGRQLLAYGFSVDELVGSFDMLGDVASALSIPLGDLIYVYGTLRSQNQAYARDLMQFGMRGIPIFDTLAEVMNTNSKQIKKMTEEGKIGFTEVEKAFKLMTQEGGRFSGMMEKSMETFYGMKQVFKGMKEIWLGAFTEGLFNALKGVINDVTEIMKDSEDTIRTFGNTIGVVFENILNAAIGFLEILSKIPPQIFTVVTALLGTYGLAMAIKRVAQAVGLLNTAFSIFTPTGAIIMGISVAIGLIVTLVGKMKRARDEAKETNAEIMKQIREMKMTRGDWESIAGMSEAMYSHAIDTGQIEKALEIADKRAELFAKMEEQGPTRELNKAKDVEDALDTYLISIQKLMLDLEDGMIDFNAHVMAGLGGVPDILEKGISEQLQALDTKVFTALHAGQFDLAQQYAQEMQEYIKEYIKKIDPANIKKDLGDLAQQLEDEFLGILSPPDSKDTIAEWVRWVEEVTKIPKEKFESAETGSYLGKLFAEEFMKGTESVERAIKEMVGIAVDETEYLEREFELILDLLSKMYSATTESGESLFNFISRDGKNDEAVKTLIARLRDLLVEIDKFNNLPDTNEWFENLASFLKEQEETYERFLAEQRDMELEYEYEIMKEKINNMTNISQEQIKHLNEQGDYAFKNATELNTYLLKMLDERYDAEKKQLELERYREQLQQKAQAAQVLYNAGLISAVDLKKAELELEIEGLKILVEKGLLTQEQLDAYREMVLLAEKYNIMSQGDPKYFDRIRNQMAGGDFSKAYQLPTEGTDLGNLIAGADHPIVMFIEALANALMSVEEFAQVMNFIQTIVQQVVELLGPVISQTLKPILKVINILAQAIGRGLLPIIQILSPILEALATVINEVIKVIYAIYQQIGNIIIKFINGFIKLLNRIIGIFSKKQLELIDEIGDLMEGSVDRIQQINTDLDTIAQEREKYINQLKTLYNKEVDTLQDLYEVGAISATEYEERIAGLQKEYGDLGLNFDPMITSLDAVKTALDALAAQEEALKNELAQLTLSDGQSTTTEETGTEKETGAGTGKPDWVDVPRPFATGAPQLPSDLMAQLHRGEMVVPKTFADAIRSGDLTLGGQGAGTGNTVIVQYNGTVIEEKNAARNIAQLIDKEQRRGYIRR